MDFYFCPKASTSSYPKHINCFFCLWSHSLPQFHKKIISSDPSSYSFPGFSRCLLFTFSPLRAARIWRGPKLQVCLVPAAGEAARQKQSGVSTMNFSETCRNHTSSRLSAALHFGVFSLENWEGGNHL